MRYLFTSPIILAALGACAAPLSSGETTGETSQAVTAAPNPGQYEIVPQYATSECLETIGANTGNGATAETWNCATSGDPRWKLVQISSGVYEIHQAIGGECLTVNGANFANGTNLVLWSCNGQAGSRWAIAASGSNWTIKPVDNQSYCMDVNAGSSSDGTKMQVWTCSGSGGSSNQQFKLNQASTLTAGYARSQNGNQYTIAVTVTNNSPSNASNWQVALNLWGATINSSPSYGGTGGVTNGSVYYNNGLATLTPANGQTVPAGASATVTFTATTSNTNWWPTIVNISGVPGASAPMVNDGVDHIARAAATAALNVVTAWESGKTTNTMVDFTIIDSHSFMLSSDGSQIVFDPYGPAAWYETQDAVNQLAAAQQDPSVASYLVSGLLSCFADSGPNLVYGLYGGALRGWSYTTTPQNITLNTSIGTDNINRVGSNVNGTEQITMIDTVNPNSEDRTFGLFATIPYSTFVVNSSDSTYAKFHNSVSVPCSPFNGPGGAANPYLVISVNGNHVGARQQLPVADCTYASNCTSTVVVDPVAYASPGQFYDGYGNLIGPATNPFALDPNVSIAYSPDHQGQWGQDPSLNWGQFSAKTFSNGRYWYKWSKCSNGTYSASGC